MEGEEGGVDGIVEEEGVRGGCLSKRLSLGSAVLI